MVRVNVFGVQACGKCLKVKSRVSQLIAKPDVGRHVQLVFWDQETVEGRAEGAWYDVDNELPVTVIEKDNRSVARWEGTAPKSEEIALCLSTVQHVAAD